MIKETNVDVLLERSRENIEYHTYPTPYEDLIRPFLPNGCVSNGISGDPLGRGPFGSPSNCYMMECGWVYDEGIQFHPGVWTREEVDEILEEGRQYQDLQVKHDGPVTLSERVDLKKRMKKLCNRVRNRIRRRSWEQPDSNGWKKYSH